MICNDCVYWNDKMCLKDYQPEDEDYCIYFFAEVKWQEQRRQNTQMGCKYRGGWTNDDAND